MRSIVASAAGALALLSSCATKPPAPPAAALGESKLSAIEVCMPAGQRTYLSRLVCPSGDAPTFRRIGSLGPRTDPPKDASKELQQTMLDQLLKRRPLAPGEPDYHIIDSYELSCGERKRTLYFDMYHCDGPAPSVAPADFRIKAAG